MTSDQIQKLIFEQYDRLGGGIISIAPDWHTFTNQVLIPNKIRLDLNGGRIAYSGKLSIFGMGVRSGSGDHEGGEVHNFRYNAPSASAVGPHKSAQLINDVRASGITPEPSTQPTISFNRPGVPTENVTGLYISDISKNVGGTTIDVRGNVVHIKRVQGGRILLDGNGTFTDSQVHDGVSGRGQLTAKGKWSIDAWIESIGGILFDGAEITSMKADWTAQPKQPVRGINGTTLNIVGPVPFQTNNGGQPTDPAARKLLLQQCYQFDKTSGVYQAGKLIVGSLAN